MRVKVPEFKRLNLVKTNAERQAEVDQIAPSMINDPAPIRDLAERLDDLTVTPSPKARRWRPARRTSASTGSSTPEAFDELKAATDDPARRDELHRQIAKAFEPLVRDGVLGYEHPAAQRGVEPDLAVRGLDQKPSDAHRVPRETGRPRARVEARRPRRPRVRRRLRPDPARPDLFRLVAEKLEGTPAPSPIDPQYTTFQRERAHNRVKEIYDTYRQGRRPRRAR